MKIRFPKIEYSVHIHPKPRGNWRPQVDFSLRMKVQKGECAWRPYLTGIAFVAQSRFEKNRDNLREHTTIDGVKIYRTVNDSFCIYDCGVIEDGLEYKYSRTFSTDTFVIPCDKVFWDSPKRGKGQKYNALYLEWDMYLEEGKVIVHQATFYLPWRPGVKPDYSDFGKAFSVVPRLLYEMLQDGLESGTSREHKITFTGRFWE